LFPFLPTSPLFLPPLRSTHPTPMGSR
jgi:hypothetical protein